MAGQTRKEIYINTIRALRDPHIRPDRISMTQDVCFFAPAIIPDNIARGMVHEALCLEDGFQGGPDMFGVEWTYVPQVMGSMVHGGHPLLEDVNDWERVIRFPDLDSWDWEGCAARNEGLFIDIDQPVNFNIVSGLFERLISFMDMQNALIALVDEDCQDAVKALFDRLCDFYDAYLERIAGYLRPTLIEFHDDWGSQKGPMFSYDTCEEMILPYLRRVVDSTHKYGMIFQLHCCGKVEQLVPLMAEAGIDTWSGQPLNDFDKVIESCGDRFVVGVTPPPLPEGAGDDRAYSAGVDFARKYVPLFDAGKPILAFTRRTHPVTNEAIMEESGRLLGPRESPERT